MQTQFCPVAFFIDQLNRIVDLQKPVRRIVSLVPSQTELLSYLQLDDEVVGITKFCVHPDAWFRSKTRVGGTKTINLTAVQGLQPDLVLANKEESPKEQIDLLAQQFPVWVSDVNTLDDAYRMILAVGEITGKEPLATSLVAEIKESFSTLKKETDLSRAAYLIWREPYMTVGGDTFIHHLMEAAGFQNAFGHQNRYPVVTPPDLQQAGCEVVLLSSEPYPFTQSHLAELQNLLPNTQVVLVDGELFSWYGSRLLKEPDYFQRLRSQIGLKT